jgi:hypothetical protein
MKNATTARTPNQKEFFEIVRERIAHPGSKSDALLHEFLRLEPFPVLRECVFGYVMASKGKAQDPRSIHSFYSLLSTAVANGEPYYAFKVNLLINSAGSAWATLCAQFQDYQRTDLRNEIAKKTAAARFIDDLRFA